MNNEAKIKALLEKRKEVEERLRTKLKKFRGVPHESASGELAYSEIKVLEDFLESIKAEIRELEKGL